MGADLARDGALCAMYIVLNAALNFANRWALGVYGFSFPLILTTAHMLLNPMFLAPAMILMEGYRKLHVDVLRDNWRGLLCVAALNGIQIAMNNSSLVHIELSMNQVVRAVMPVIVAAFEVLRGCPPSGKQLPTLGMICLGVIMVVYQPSAAAAEFWGVLLVTLSVSMQAAQMSFAGGLLSMKLDSFQLTFYTSPMALSLLAGPAWHLEGSGFQEYLTSRPSVAAAVLVGTCLLAVFYNVVVFQTIHRLSPIGSSVLGNVKVVVLLLISSLLMGEMKQWTGRQYAGCALTFLGAGLYSLQKATAAKSKKS